VLSTVTELDHYQQQFAEFLTQITKHSDWVNPVRQQALAEFHRLGFPTTKNEDWRFTNVAPIARVPFRLSRQPEKILLQEQELSLLVSEGTDCQIVFLNGFFCKELSLLSSLPGGIQVRSLNEARNDSKAQEHLLQHASFNENGFVALNTAFLEDGAYIFVPDGIVAEVPIQILFLSSFHDDARVIFPRNLIVVGKSSQVTVIENYVSLSSVPHFTNAVTEISIGENATLKHCKLQQEADKAFHIATIQTDQDRNSSYVSHSISIGAAIGRTDLNVLLNGEGSNCILNGLYIASRQQHVDNHTTIDHAKPHCTSSELYKGILAGKSRGVFNGEIIVRKEAQLTDARQTNKNLLLSEGASVNTKPQLQILADDVKCMHGATIGQLEEQAIFYLNSRGLDRATAEGLLTFGFANEVAVSVTQETLQVRLSRLILKTLNEIARQGGMSRPGAGSAVHQYEGSQLTEETK
jgi:Fe-S cluster assembly protein SufD